MSPQLSHHINLSTEVKHVVWPQSLQSAVWTLQKITQTIHVWIRQLVFTQVQLSQMGGVGLQSWGQRSTADLWQPAAFQSDKRINAVSLEDSALTWNHSVINNLFKKKMRKWKLQTSEPNRTQVKTSKIQYLYSAGPPVAPSIQTVNVNPWNQSLLSFN